MLLIYIVLAVIVIALFLTIVIYNGLVRLRNQVDEAWSGIDVQLKRRHDLVPNLVSSVKGYQQHEASTLETVTQLRSQAMAANTMEEKAKAENALSLGIGKLFAVAENYPDLKASQNFLDLQQQLANVEDQIQLSRRYYNGTTRDYNTKIQSFPQNILANLFHFTARTFFQLSDEAEKNTPTVNFNQ